MKFEKLGNIAKIQIGKTPKRAELEYWGKGYPWVSISDMKSEVIENTKEEITEKAIKECNCKIIPRGTLLMSFKLSVGKLAFAGTDLYTNEAICGILINDSKKIDSKYFYYALKNTKFLGSNTAVMGTTLNTESLNNLQIPFIDSVTEQKHIAEVLSKAEALIAERKQSIQLLDEYLKSTFLEMFGDPVKNEKGWEKVLLKDYCTKIGSGSTPRGGKESYFEKGISLIRSLNVHNDQFVMKDLAHIDDKQAYDLRNVTIEIDDVLLNITGASVARCCIVPEDILPARVNQHVSILRTLKDKLSPMFLNRLITNDSFQKFLIKTSRSKGATREAITKEELETLKIILPPFKLQTQFAAIVGKTEALKAQYKEHLQSLEQMYGALSQRAFRGEIIKLKLPKHTQRV